MPIQVFMDESNVHEGTDFLTVSAAWAHSEVWKAWEADWLHAIKPLSHFHSYDVWNRERSCKEMSKEVRDLISSRAMQVICRHKIRGRIGEVNRKQLEQELGGAKSTRDYVEHPYILPFIWVINRIFELLKSEGVHDAEFIHETNDFEKSALEHFETRKARVGCEGYSLKFEGKQSRIPLQCADVLAFFGMKRLQTPHKRPLALEVADGGSMRIQALTVSNEQLAELTNTLSSSTPKFTGGSNGN